MQIWPLLRMGRVRSATLTLFGSNFEVDYGSEEQAFIVYKTLAVGKEVK